MSLHTEPGPLQARLVRPELIRLWLCENEGCSRDTAHRTDDRWTKYVRHTLTTLTTFPTHLGLLSAPMALSRGVIIERGVVNGHKKKKRGTSAGWLVPRSARAQSAHAVLIGIRRARALGDLCIVISRTPLRSSAASDSDSMVFGKVSVAQ